MTIAVRAFGGGVADGTVLSRQTVFLAPPPMFGDVVAHAAFSPPLVLEPPGQFVIEGPHEQARIVSWYGRDDDPYARGAGFACGGQPVSGFDLNFRTFAPDDLAAPETALVSGPRPGSFAPSATAAFAFTAADDLSYASNVRFECSLDGAAAVPCASPFETGRLDDGHHIFTVDAIDEAGRRDATAATTAWTVDVAPPTAPKITGPSVVRARGPSTASPPEMRRLLPRDCSSAAPSTPPRCICARRDSSHG